MKNPRLLKTCPRGRSRLGRKILTILLSLALAVSLAAPAGAAPADSYESLRLFTEALYEISQKSVWQKNEAEMVYGALRGMMNSLDPDSSFLTPREYQDFLHGNQKPAAEAGVELIYKDNLLTVASSLDGGPAHRAGLRPGDHILKINGKLVRNLTTQEATRRFQGHPGKHLKLHVLRNGVVKPLKMTITLEPLGGSTVTSQVLKDSVGYIRVRFFSDDTPRELAAALKALQQQSPLRGVILDLRNNARGTLEQAVRTAGVLLGDQVIVSTKGRLAVTEQSYQGRARELVFKPAVPMVVLVDQGTARAAEIVAGALGDDAAATLLGAKTLGLCGLTKVFPLQDGSALVMTVAQCYTPEGKKIQGKGLEPQVAGRKAPSPGPSAKEAPKTVLPEQDPWVIQALELITSGKPRPVAKKSH